MTPFLEVQCCNWFNVTLNPSKWEITQTTANSDDDRFHYNTVVVCSLSKREHINFSHRSSNLVRILDLISQDDRHKSIGNPRKVVLISPAKGYLAHRVLTWDYKR